MALRYCYFWMPTVFHTEINPINSEKKQKDISDGVGKSLHLSLELDNEEKNLIVFSKSEEDEVLMSFVLTLIQKSKNGLFSYSYDLPSDLQNDSIYIYNEIPNAIYHLAKSFYHEHEHHDINGDSMLDAYVCDCFIDISEDDNEVLIHYLCKYEEKFIISLETLQDQYEYLLTEGVKPESSADVFLNKHRSFNKSCVDLLGEAIYCDSLLKSRHNLSIKSIPETIEGSPKRDLYKKAINIQNALKGIELLQKRNIADFEFKNARVNLTLASETRELLDQHTEILRENDKLGRDGVTYSKRGLIYGIIGASFGVLGLTISVLSYFSSKNVTVGIEKLLQALNP